MDDPVLLVVLIVGAIALVLGVIAQLIFWPLWLYARFLRRRIGR